MTIERQDILEDFYVGVHKNIRDTIYDSDGNLFDLTGGEVNFYMFDDLTGEVYITKTSAYADEVLITDAVNGEAVVYLNPNDTTRKHGEDLYGTYRYQIQAIDSNGNSEIVTTGKINIFRSPSTGRPRKDSVPAYLSGQ